MKTCKVCKRLMPQAWFNRKAATRDGRDDRCKVCQCIETLRRLEEEYAEYRRVESVYKTCPKCGKRKSLTQFNKNKQAKDGWTYYCKECISIVNHGAYKRRASAKAAEVERKKGLPRKLLQNPSSCTQKDRKYLREQTKAIHANEEIVRKIRTVRDSALDEFDLLTAGMESE